MTKLTQKQNVLLHLLADGSLSDREIALALQVPERAVGGLVTHALDTCGLTSREQVADYLAQRKEAKQ